jgi:hypothetical protein
MKKTCGSGNGNLLSALPMPSRAPTNEEVDALLASWSTRLNNDSWESRRLVLDITELGSILGPKFGESELVMGFCVRKMTDMIVAASSMDAVKCMLEVTSTLMIGIAAGIRLGLMMERNDRTVSESLEKLDRLNEAVGHDMEGTL